MKEIFKEENSSDSPEFKEIEMTPRDYLRDYILNVHPFVEKFFTAEELWDVFSKKTRPLDVRQNMMPSLLKDLAEEGYLTYDAQSDRYCERPPSFTSIETNERFNFDKDIN
jgi:hypothetical protein